MIVRGKVHVVYGPQGAGKSTFAGRLAEQTGAVSFRIDDWMLGLFMPDLPQQPSLEWIVDRTQRCEQVIWSVCSQLLALGTEVVLDLGLLRHKDRKRVRLLAQGAGAEVQFYFIDSARDIRLQRVLARNVARGKTFSFFVTPEMFDFMEGVYEAPSGTERELSVLVET